MVPGVILVVPFMEMPRQNMGKSSSRMGMVSRTEPLVTMPQIPFILAAVVMISPQMPPSQKPSTSTTRISPGRAMDTALWSIRLSPGRALTVSAEPTTKLPGQTGRISWVIAPRFPMTSWSVAACMD